MMPPRQRRSARARHADDWLMTYADMITLLLCFFAVFVALSVPKKQVPPKTEPPLLAQVEPAIPPVQPPVKQPQILEGNLPFHAIPELDRPEDDVGNGDASGMSDASGARDEPGAPSVAAVAQADAPPEASGAKEAAPPPDQPAQASLSDIVRNLKPQEAALDEKSDRLTTLQISSGTFFASGSAALNASGRPILQAVAANLKSDKFKGYVITIEGHTDDQPIHTAQFPSNWELSTARAAAVVHFFLDQGIPAQRLRAAGYADTFPLVPNRDAKGSPIPENQARNRRVVIKLERVEKAEQP